MKPVTAKKILIAEDDKFLASAYNFKFNKLGYTTKIVVDGEEALEVLPSFKPDIIILDLIMPNLDGFGVLEALRKDDKYKKLPIIVASNLGQKEDIDRAKNLGATDFLIKSDLSLDTLVEKIQKMLA